MPTGEAQRRKLWEERIGEILISEFEMDDAGAQAILDEMKTMDIMEACAYLDRYGFCNAAKAAPRATGFSILMKSGYRH